MGLQEHVILVNHQGEVTGTQEKYAAHTSHTPLHLAFSCWVFNRQGQLLITRRSLSKKAWPGVWTNSVCGHPQLGESDEQAILRRCHFEIGASVDSITAIHPGFRYRETDPSGIVENEVCPVYAARIDGDVIANPDEVMAYQWVDLDAILQGLDATPWAFSPWMVSEASPGEGRDNLRRFTARLQQ